MQTVFLLAPAMFQVLLIDRKWMQSATHVALELRRDDPGHPRWTSLSQHPQPGSPLLKDLRGVSGLLHPLLETTVPALPTGQTAIRPASPLHLEGGVRDFLFTFNRAEISPKHLTHVQAS